MWRYSDCPITIYLDLNFATAAKNCYDYSTLKCPHYSSVHAKKWTFGHANGFSDAHFSDPSESQQRGWLALLYFGKYFLKQQNLRESVKINPAAKDASTVFARDDRRSSTDALRCLPGREAYLDILQAAR